MKDNLIAIDTEYRSNKDLDTIIEVYCIAACDCEGNKFTKWFYVQNDSGILDEIAGHFGVENPLYICYAFGIAERKALIHLGVDINKYNFADSYLIETFLVRPLDKATCPGLKLTETTKRYGLPERDAEQKELMRQYCITDTTAGHEQEIMDYCFDDTKDLIPIYKKQRVMYREAIKYALNIHRNQALSARFNKDSKRYWDIEDDQCIDNIFIRHTEFVKACGAVSDIGLPVDYSRIEHLKKRVDIIEQNMREALLKYNALLFRKHKDGSYSKSNLICSQLIQEDCDRLNIKDYPVSDNGLLKMDQDTLKEYFKQTDGFGHDFYSFNRHVTLARQIEHGTPEHIHNGYIQYGSLKPFGAKTGRSQPSTSCFIFGWWKGFYPVLQPQDDDTWLVELDMKAQETFFQATLCKDQRCYDAYASKDMYMYFLNQFGIIPDDDWYNLSTKELKDKYHKQRKCIKSVILGTSYGMGVSTLAKRQSITLDQAKEQLEMVNSVLSVSDGWKKELYNLCNQFDYISTDDFMLTKLPIINEGIYTKMKNYSFQSMGATVLRWIVRELYNNTDKYRIRLVGTVHDAIVFECKKGDLQAIKRVNDTMVDLANYYSFAPDGWTIKVDAPEIVEKGDWFVDVDNFEAFLEMWTDNPDEQVLIRQQYKEQQERNKRYIEQYNKL